MEGGLKKQTLKTKNKAACFCNKMRWEDPGAEVGLVLAAEGLVPALRTRLHV